LSGLLIKLQFGKSAVAKPAVAAVDRKFLLFMIVVYLNINLILKL
jgi:hypothetical protein